jgi:hypothetical protein
MKKKLEVIAEIKSGVAELESVVDTDLEFAALKFVQDRVSYLVEIKKKEAEKIEACGQRG